MPEPAQARARRTAPAATRAAAPSAAALCGARTHALWHHDTPDKSKPNGYVFFTQVYFQSCELRGDPAKYYHNANMYDS